MALANFFDKTALAAAEVLAGFDYSLFKQKIENEIVGIGFDHNCVSTREGQWTLELTTSLCARIYPRLCFFPTDAAASKHMDSALNLALRINPDVSIEPKGSEVTASLVIGSSPSPWPGSAYIGSDGWLAAFSPTSPQGSVDSSNPFGAAAAACFGAANIFRSIFKTQLFEGGLDSSFKMSLLSFERANSPVFNPPIPEFQLKDVPLVGLGAIGNGALWVLSKLAGLSGSVHLIDPEPVELTNLQRYVATEQSSVGKPKTEVAKGLFQRGLRGEAYSMSWGQYVSQRLDTHFEAVAVSVDSAAARCEVQASLPRWVVNAWTQALDLGISTHQFADDFACLVCLYLPKEKSLNEDEIIARALGLEGNVRPIREMLAMNIPVSEDFLRRLSEIRGIPTEPLLPFVGRSLREFYSRAVCGGLLLSLDPTGQRLAEPVPMAFQSALAGILMASELVAHVTGLKHTPPPVTTRINLLQPLGSQFSQKDRKDSGGRCICQDGDYLAAYRAKYGSAPTRAQA